MKVRIELKLCATLQPYAPADADRYSVETGTSMEEFVEALRIPEDQIKLLFCNSVTSGLETILRGRRPNRHLPAGGRRLKRESNEFIHLRTASIAFSEKPHRRFFPSAAKGVLC